MLAAWIKPSRLKKVAILIKPATILRFHRAIVDGKYRKLYSNKSPRRPGPKGSDQSLVELILDIKLHNPGWGNDRIARTITHSFGIELNKDVVRRVLAKHYKPPSPSHDGPSWLTFLSNLKDSTWSVDFFRCESINFKSYMVMVAMDIFSRRIVGLAITPYPVQGNDACRMFAEIIRKERLPKYISTDNDPVFRYHRWLATLRVLDIEELKSVPCTPISHPFIESLVGTLRREYLDHLLFFGENDLRRKLNEYKDYYNRHRVHSALGALTPAEKAGKPAPGLADLGNYRWASHCKGMFQTPLAA